MKKLFFRTEILTLIVIAAIFILLPLAAYSQGNSSDEYGKLKIEYQKVLADRDNMLIQTRALLEYKARALELENRLKVLQAEKENTIASLKQDKENAVKKLQEEKDRLKLELDSAKEQFTQLSNRSQDELTAFQQRIEDLEGKNAQLSKDRDNLQDSLEKLAIEYKIIPETKKKVIRLESEKDQLLNDYRKMEQKFKAMEEERLNKDAQLEIYRIQINDFKKQYAEAIAKNKEFEKKLEQMPPRMAELARENKILIKETALTHYNLGVFYTKNKDYSRAVAEFEKASELNPDDPYTYYNLGYIYAEYLPDRPKAVENFRRFLGLCRTEDKDVDWVKKYILTWQTWEGKKPIK